MRAFAFCSFGKVECVRRYEPRAGCSFPAYGYSELEHYTASGQEEHAQCAYRGERRSDDREGERSVHRYVNHLAARRLGPENGVVVR
jgi:hypothetical protein